MNPDHTSNSAIDYKELRKEPLNVDVLQKPGVEILEFKRDNGGYFSGDLPKLL